MTDSSAWPAGSYCRKVMGAILAHWPEWQGAVKVVRKTRKHYLSLEVPPIKPIMTRGLEIVVGKNWTCLYFESDELHVDDYLDTESSIERLTVQLIGDYLAEKLISVSWWQEGELKLSTLIHPDDDIPEQSSLRGNVICHLRSWAGTFDKDILQIGE